MVEGVKNVLFVGTSLMDAPLAACSQE